MSNEIPKIDRWIYEALASDNQIAAIVGDRIYRDQAPEAAAYPFLIFSFSDGEAINGMGTCRVMTRARYLVKVVNLDSIDSNARTLADRIDEIIGTATRAVHSQDSTIRFSARLESPISYTEAAANSGRNYRHLGGLYTIEAS